MDWQDISTAPRDGSRLLLIVTLPSGPIVAVGGYDNHWTGQCWVWEKSRIQVGTVPEAWQPLPAPPQSTGGE